jgi:hypothetical protein
LNGLDGTTTVVSVSSSGAFTGNNSGCLISGSITPRTSGKNIFNVTVTAGTSPCLSPGATYTGIAVTYLIAGTSTRQLIVAGVNATRTAGNAFFGVR